MKIEVTQEDIDRGIQCNGHYCPIARATRRATGLPMLMLPTTGLSFLRPGHHKYELIPTPEECFTFAGAFDRGWAVEPFSFELEFGVEE